jgi:hypothetical protein
MEELIRQAFLHVEEIGPHVADGHYDLVGPTGEIILPQVWETVIQPDLAITMYMWSIPEKLRGLPDGVHIVDVQPTRRPPNPAGRRVARAPTPPGGHLRGSSPPPPSGWIGTAPERANIRPPDEIVVIETDDNSIKLSKKGFRNLRFGGVLGGKRWKRYVNNPCNAILTS